jgi:hypothetical protein
MRRDVQNGRHHSGDECFPFPCSTGCSYKIYPVQIAFHVPTNACMALHWVEPPQYLRRWRANRRVVGRCL